VKRFIILLLVLAGILAAGVLLFVQFYSPEAQRAALERRLSEAFGAPAHIGSLKLSLSGGMGVEARDVRVELDAEFGEGSLLEIDEVLANVSVWHFLTTRELGVRAVRVTRPRIRFVKNPDGAWNWSTLGPAAVAEAAPRAIAPALAFFSPMLASATSTTSSQLERIGVSDANVTLVDLTVQPPIVTEYRGLALDAAIATSGLERQVSGRILGDSEAAGGEPLDVDVPFELRMSRVGDTRRWKADGTIETGRISTRNARLEDIVATFSLDEAQRLVLPSLRMRLFGGQVDGSASIDLGTATNRFTMQGNVTQLDLASALAPKPELSGSLHGIAAATFRLNGELGSYSETLLSLEGVGSAEVENARLESVNLLSEISKRANLTPVEFSETDTTSGKLSTGFRFERGSLRISGANASRVSGCVDLFVRDGIIGLGDRPALDLTGTVTILPEIQQRVRADSTAAQLVLVALTRGTGMKVPLRVTGSVAAPSVDLDWSSVVRSMLMGAAAR
jgi:hypothetical protein